MHPSTAAIRRHPARTSAVSPAAWVAVGLLASSLAWGGAWLWQRTAAGATSADSAPLTPATPPLTAAAPTPGAIKPLPVAGDGVAGDAVAGDADAGVKTGQPVTPPVASSGKAAPIGSKSRSDMSTHGVQEVTSPMSAHHGRATPAATVVSVCNSCGVVEAVEAVRKDGQAHGIGAVAGGVVGGALGNRVGGGSGKTAMTVLGAVGGGLAGHAIEKRAKAVTVYRVKVRMQDGTLRNVTHGKTLAIGAKVNVSGQVLTVPGDRPAAAGRNTRA